jgi:hypothetical protein
LLFRESGDGFPVMGAMIDGVTRRALDLSEPFEAWQPYVIEQTRTVFDNEGLPEQWPALSPGYAAWKERAYPGQTIGRRTDRMYESFTKPDNPEMIWETGPRSIRYGSRVPYWRKFDAKREIIPILPETFVQLTRLVRDYVMNDETGGEPMVGE